MKINQINGLRGGLRSVQVLGLGALALALSAPGWAKPSPSGGGKIVWQTSFEHAMAQAKKSHKPMFVDFYATWCGPCKGLEAMVFPTPQFTRAARGYVMVRVDGDKRPDLIKKYAVDAQGRVNYPSMGFFSRSGKLVKLQVGVPVPEGSTTAADAYKAASFEIAHLLTAYKSRA